MSFITAMNSVDSSDLSSEEDQMDTKVGVNGSDVYTTKGFGNRLVSFYTMLNRGMSAQEIEKNIKELIRSDKATLIDLLVLMFQTRDIRGGKGERDLFHIMMKTFLNNFPEHAYKIIEFIPEYGYWQDLWEIYEMVTASVKEDICKIVKVQFEKDRTAETPSLLAKWLPREKSKYNDLAKHFATILFPDVPTKDSLHLRSYRQAVSELNRKIQTTEIKMCGKIWSAIEPRKVPGRLMKKCKKAFLNEKKKGRDESLRYPDNKDRMECREHFQAYIEDLKSGKEVAKGANVLMPHELVKECYNDGYDVYESEDEDSNKNKKITYTDDLIQEQWNSIKNATKLGGGLEKCVFMCDFSGSMAGNPMLVSLGLGILGSEITAAPFAEHILTFDAEPKWHSFTACKTLREKINSISGLGQGLNTDFQKACELILKKLVEHKVPVEEAPTELIVLTDMGFDAARNVNSGYNIKKQEGWETHFQMIRKSFEEQGYKPPRIVCWNLRADFKDFHSKADEVGVVNLSGWSASAFKALQTSGVDILTPEAMVRKILDDERYNPIRKLAETLFKA
jgi:hypothetical protein